MLKKIINNKYIILELIVIFLITLFYNLICSNLSGDEIWNYGFSYNISSGLIPYKDFNMITTPLFPLLGALFLNIFGKSFLIYHIFNSIICTILFYTLKKYTKKNYYFSYLLILMNSYPSYNLLCLLLLYILMICENKKTNDYLIGLILGLAFLTKQNIGIYLCIPTLFIKNYKKIIKRIIGFVIPILFLIIYLIFTNSLFEFINYTVLGIFNFTKENNYISPIAIIIFIISTVTLIYKYLKNKDITIIYLIMFQLLLFPMNDNYHLMLAFIPTISYILSKIKIHKIIPIIFSLTYIVTIFSTNIYSIIKENVLFPNDTQSITYKKLSPKLNNYLLKTSNLVSKIDNDTELFIICKNAYLIKLEASLSINKYDLLNNGNLGKEGEQGIIKDIETLCSTKKCIFLLELETESTYHYAREIKNFIIDNYPGGSIMESFAVYRNH